MPLTCGTTRILTFLVESPEKAQGRRVLRSLGQRSVMSIGKRHGANMKGGKMFMLEKRLS